MAYLCKDSIDPSHFPQLLEESLWQKNQLLLENLCVQKNRKKRMYLETGPSHTGRAPLRPRLSPTVLPARPELTTGVADLTWAGSFTVSDPELGLEVRSQGLLVTKAEDREHCELWGSCAQRSRWSWPQRKRKEKVQKEGQGAVGPREGMSERTAAQDQRHSGLFQSSQNSILGFHEITLYPQSKTLVLFMLSHVWMGICMHICNIYICNVYTSCICKFDYYSLIFAWASLK